MFKPQQNVFIFFAWIITITTCTAATLTQCSDDPSPLVVPTLALSNGKPVTTPPTTPRRLNLQANIDDLPPEITRDLGTATARVQRDNNIQPATPRPGATTTRGGLPSTALLFLNRGRPPKTSDETKVRLRMAMQQQLALEKKLQEEAKARKSALKEDCENIDLGFSSSDEQ